MYLTSYVHDNLMIHLPNLIITIESSVLTYRTCNIFILLYDTRSSSRGSPSSPCRGIQNTKIAQKWSLPYPHLCPPNLIMLYLIVWIKRISMISLLCLGMAMAAPSSDGGEYDLPTDHRFVFVPPTSGVSSVFFSFQLET